MHCMRYFLDISSLITIACWVQELYTSSICHAKCIMGQLSPPPLSMFPVILSMVTATSHSRLYLWRMPSSQDTRRVRLLCDRWRSAPAQRAAPQPRKARSRRGRAAWENILPHPSLDLVYAYELRAWVSGHETSPAHHNTPRS